ncbi:unnamed protein product [Cladocopium goreaui]|uniref:Uncharacterized protein n=1 Tax=Cladocopium goreaui TaxID=2562237 RepID=A0A9P1DH10_9DINO|nr:unnamed protein product [Cladocopium goreaui]
MAVEDLQTARQTGDERKIREAKEDVKEAKEEVKEAEEKVQKAEEKVQKAKEEVQEKVDRDATAFANELASIGQPEGLDAGVQLFKLNRSLTADYRMSGTAMLSRKTIRVAWDAAFEEMEQGHALRVAMVGMPGIGKSRSLTYGLWRLMTREVPPVVVFEARRGQKVFIFTWQNNQWVVRSVAINNWIPANCKYLQDERNFYLIDAFAPEQWDAILPAKTIKACSPDRKHHSGFVKDGGIYVYVEAWSEAEVEAAHPYIDGAPKLSEMLRRFEQVGGNLRVLLSNVMEYDKYVLLQREDPKNLRAVERAVRGDLDTQGGQMLTRLFTYFSKNGRSSCVGFCSKGAAKMVLDAHYDDLMKIWSNPNDPEGDFLFEQFVGTIFTTSLLEGQRLDRYSITRKAGKWDHTKCQPLMPCGCQLLECDSEVVFDQRWRAAVEKGGLEEVLLHTPKQYPGIDYLLDFNHGIQVTQSDKHSIAPKFLEKLHTAFDGHKGYNFTLTFMVVREPTSFKPKDLKEFNGLMKLAQGKERVFSKVWVDVIQMPKTRDSLPKKKCCKGSASRRTAGRAWS